MKTFGKKPTAAGWLCLSSLLLALVSFVLYLVNSLGGYFADGGIDGRVLAFHLVGLLAFVAFLLLAGKNKWADTGFYLLIGIFLLLAFGFTISQRAEPIGDMLVPVNHPLGEIKAVKVAMTGIVFNGLSFLTLAVASFFASPVKKEKPTPLPSVEGK